jgi:cytosine/adenosine deaminase-related metal-dependent hydrolase
LEYINRRHRDMQNPSVTLAGHALIGEDLALEPVEIVVEGGKVVAVEPYAKKMDRWICPAFFNAHTHLADTVAMDCTACGSLEDLVAPPHGLKHRILAATPPSELVAGMRASIGTMLRSGTAGFADFREGGRAGVLALREAAAGLPCRPVIFGREGGEQEGEGIGISSIRDVAGVEQQIRQAKQQGKLVAFHAGERDPLDVDGALVFEPDLLVHCTHATDSQLRECADRGIPIAVCPRSNWMLGVAGSRAHPPLARMIEFGCTLLLGTDNAMFVQPDMLQEMAFVSYVYRLDPKEILRAAIRGSVMAGSPYFIKKGVNANLFSIERLNSNLRFSMNPYETIVKRLSASDIGQNVLCLK